MSNKGRSCGCKGQGSRKSRERFYNSEDFMVNCFKVLPCFKKYRHDWWVCPYAHEGETAKRRDPKKFKYVGVACPDAKQGKACPRGDECPCTHNVFEYWLHPTRFRTAFCGRGIHCTRPFCFFAHSLSEMRKPSLDDLLPVIEGDSLFNEEMLKAALEDHKRDVARLGGKDTCLELLDMSFLQAPRNEDGSHYNISPRDVSPGGMSHYNSPTASPRDLSPGSLPMNQIPNMQSPRGVVSFMNAILRGVDPNDISPQKLQYGVQGETGQMVSPRDLSPVGTNGIGDGLPGTMRSPRGFSPVVSRGSPGGMPSPRGLSPTALQQMQGFDQEALAGALQALRDYSPTSPHMQSMYGGGHDISGIHTSPRLGLSPSPRGRTAGYDLSNRDNSPQTSPHTGTQGSRILQHSASAREHGQHGGLFSGYQSAGANERARSNSPGIRGMDEHSIAAVREVLAALENSGMNGGVLQHQFHADQLGMESILGGMPTEHRSPSLEEMTGNTSMPMVDPDNGGGIPESVQAVLRSLAQEELTAGGDDINRPFSSLSQLW